MPKCVSVCVVWWGVAGCECGRVGCVCVCVWVGVCVCVCVCFCVWVHAAPAASEAKYLPRLLLDKVLRIGNDRESVALADLSPGFT